jgi:hypothetical protein
VRPSEGLNGTWETRAEYYGRSTGLPWRPYIDRTAQQVHPEWIRSEEAQIIADADPRIWLVFAHYRGTENALLDHVEKGGMRQVGALHERGAVAFLYERVR